MLLILSKERNWILDVDLDLPISDIRRAYNYEKYDEGVRKAAANSLFECIVTADFDRARNRNIREAVEVAFAKCDAGQGDYLTDEQLHQLIGDVMEELTPFIQHNAEQFGYRP